MSSFLLKLRSGVKDVVFEATAQELRSYADQHPDSGWEIFFSLWTWVQSQLTVASSEAKKPIETPTIEPSGQSTQISDQGEYGPDMEEGAD